MIPHFRNQLRLEALRLRDKQDSDFTAFMYLGELIEMDKTDKMFTNPAKKLTEEYITGRFG